MSFQFVNSGHTGSVLFKPMLLSVALVPDKGNGVEAWKDGPTIVVNRLDYSGRLSLNSMGNEKQT